MPITVLWRGTLPEAEAERVRAALGEGFCLLVEKDPERIEPYLNEIVILVDGSASERALDAPRLKHVIIPWAGVSEPLRERMLKRPHLTLHNSHYNAPLVAQHALALLLACACRLVEFDRQLRQGDWRSRYDRAKASLYLPGKRALLLGYGAIGRELAKRLRALEMEVAAFKRNPGEPDGLVSRVYGREELLEALATSDAVIVSLPGTSETRGLLGESELAAMREHAVLVNVGRGSVIDEAALYEALRDRRILAAGLDVWWRYPEDEAARSSTLPSNLPFHELDNVVMSPHRANEMQEDLKLRADDVTQTILALAKGELRNQVDLARGY
jgi:phosphoglycerate dehydrogenase-like enzyme